MSDEGIVEGLANKGHTYQEISEALNQADIKSGVAKVSGNFAESGQLQESALSRGSHDDIDIPAPSPGDAVEPEPSSFTPSVKMTPSVPIRMPPQVPSLSSEDVQELIESIIDDRWQQVVTSVGDISLWKSKVDDDLVAVKQEVLRIEDRMARLQSALVGRVDEYSKSISKVGSEVAALEKVFEKIIEPLSSNIKELNRITQELKRK